MPRICYTTPTRVQNPSAKMAASWAIRDQMIAHANTIIATYQAQGLDLTLRQLYYRFVAQDLFPAAWADPNTGSTNNDKSYNKLGDIIAYGRMAGLIDWDAIIDRTRFVRKLGTWSSPKSILRAVADQFRYDLWADQPYYLECWVEKDAAIGVIEGVCEENRVPFMSCRGYASMSEIWRAGNQRFRKAYDDGKLCRVLYLGDHDPSGIDMPRDLLERLETFMGHVTHGEAIKIDRLALNMDQIEQYNPPPNPAKETDSRCAGYKDKFGDESWELDALEPTVVRDLIENAILGYRDDDIWTESLEREDVAKRSLAVVAKKWESVTAKLKRDIEAAEGKTVDEILGD